MLKTIGVASLDELIAKTVPGSIRAKQALNLPEGMNEYQYLQHLTALAAKNKIFRTYIGLGYYNTIVPGVVIRNILENPGWYTSYTPYQAEISQGRLEALLNFQTMVSEMTAMPIANASLLDEGTAAAEAMIMFFNTRSREAIKNNVTTFLVDEGAFSQTIDVLKTRAIPLGIELRIIPACEMSFDGSAFGALLQYPDKQGELHDYKSLTEKAHAAGTSVAVAADILSLALLTPPGEWGADVVLGNTQRFGVPMGFGGPHAAYFATSDKFKRNIPGRIIGVSVDAKGNRALRMALQTREQHIKRERATSNICTAQALLAIMAGMYAVYHGPAGIKNIAQNVHQHTAALAAELEKLGVKQLNQAFFDTLLLEIPTQADVDKIQTLALEKGINFRYTCKQRIGISLDETTCLNDLNDICTVVATALGKTFNGLAVKKEDLPKLGRIPASLTRTSAFLTKEVFNSFHSETEMMRYIKKLEVKDLSLNRAMIPLGSCTMKLNAAAELFALSWPSFGQIHPFVPAEQAGGYHEMIKDLGEALCEITGFAAISFQPNSGAAGEYAGLSVIRAWHHGRGEGHRNIVLIPASAHGTNPASAVMAGMKVVVVACDEHGNVNVADLQEKATLHANELAALMVTYPSTHGVFEEDILKIIQIIHDNGGQVYMDGANMNAQVGLTSPGHIGADVCHLNLHKTFAIPHGGGGPGVGPIGVAAHLVPFLPGHPISRTGGEKSITALASAAFGSAYILPISYAYIKLLGGAGLTEATRYAILNANYLRARLEKHYPILYTGKQGMVAHEMIVDCNDIHHKTGIDAIDIAKRLMDYGFHAPTVAFPVHGTLMVEPTESEPLSELDRLCEAMIEIRKEIAEIEDGKADKANNLIMNAPHTALMIAADEWNYPYSRKRAAYPMPWSDNDKYWPAVTRIDDAYGDRNLMCSCEI